MDCAIGLIESKKVILMFNKRGIILHPATWIFAAFILGILATMLAVWGIIPIEVCNCP